MLISSGHWDDRSRDGRDVNQRGQEVEHLLVVRLLQLLRRLRSRVGFRFRRVFGRSGRRNVVLGGILDSVLALLLSFQSQDLVRKIWSRFNAGLVPKARISLRYKILWDSGSGRHGEENTSHSYKETLLFSLASSNPKGETSQVRILPDLFLFPAVLSTL